MKPTPFLISSHKKKELSVAYVADMSKRKVFMVAPCSGCDKLPDTEAGIKERANLLIEFYRRHPLVPLLEDALGQYKRCPKRVTKYFPILSIQIAADWRHCTCGQACPRVKPNEEHVVQSWWHPGLGMSHEEWKAQALAGLADKSVREVVINANTGEVKSTTDHNIK